MIEYRSKFWAVILCIGVLSASGCLPESPTSTPPAAGESAGAITGAPESVENGILPTPGEAFCSEAQVQAVLENFMAALAERDGRALAQLIDAEAGLDIYYTAASEPVILNAQAVEGLFESTESQIWGTQPGSGLPVEGTFNDQILPALLDVVDRVHVQACQSLESGIGTGPTTAFVTWPSAHAGMPFIALYRAPGEQENELDWRTWAIGFTVINGVPKIRVLVQYFWEV